MRICLHPPGRTPPPGRGERGIAIIVVLGTIIIVTTICIALVGVMDTDILHASIQTAVTRSFYIAEAGLEAAKAQVAGAADPTTYTTRTAGVTASYAGGDYTYWVDAGPASGCGPGLTTLESLGRVPFLGGTIPARVRACGVAGTPMAVALFGVSRVEVRGARSRTYLAPYGVGHPGNGSNLGSFTEIHMANPEIHVNALSEDTTETVMLRDAGTIPDYTLFGFSTQPVYNPDPAAEAAPWVLAAFGEIIKARPTSGSIPNVCGTPYACVTALNSTTDIEDPLSLRSTVESMARNASGLRHVYLSRMRKLVVPPLSLNAALFLDLAASNGSNATINGEAGLAGKTNSVYAPLEFYQVVHHLATHRAEVLRGTIYVTGTVQLVQDLDLGGPAGDVTFAVGGDLILNDDVRLTNQHDLSTTAGRETPGILVFGSPAPTDRHATICGGQRVNGSGRLVSCGGPLQRLIVDGLVYTADGMAVGPDAALDHVGAMYHNSRGTASPSFTNDNASLVIRFDPLALKVFKQGLTILSWHQLR